VATDAPPARLDDLPWAATLRPFSGELSPHGEYDGDHFSKLAFDQPSAANSRFLECALTGVTLRGGELRRSRLSDVWIEDSQLITTGLAETNWLDVTVSGALIAGSEAFGSGLRRVTFRNCKLDSVNFRDAGLTDVVFDGCQLLSPDFGGATLTRVSFGGSRLVQADLTRATLDQADLRGAELGLIIGPGSLQGAIISTGQLVTLAPVLAETIGIVVEDA
jgi:uncharacterized protein YjbI with pentapeptide repeats